MIQFHTLIFMRLIQILIIFTLVMIVIKAITPLINSIVSFKDDKIKFKINAKKESIKNMTGFEFECFSAWFLKEVYGFSDVVITPSANDGGVDLIITDNNNKKIYVECKRYVRLDEYENGQLITNLDYNFMIGREICQKLVGAMVSNNIRNGIIMTTGEIHENAIEYIEKLRENSDIDIRFITMEDIVQGLENLQSDLNYSIEVEI